MRRNMTLGALGLLALALLAAPASASSIFLSSWGVSYGNWAPAGGAPPVVAYWVEDWVSGNQGYLGPGYGGQAYDVEAAYIGVDDDYYYLGIITGFPKWGRDGYAPGDLALDVNGDNQYDFAVDVSANGLLRSVGLVWENPMIDGQPAWGGASDPLRVTAWNQSAAIANFRYGSFSGRYSIEAIVARNQLGPNNSLKLHWTMGCGNDLGEVETATTPIPEPASLTLLGGGLTLAGILGRRRRRK